jgi:hypothetical protein
MNEKADKKEGAKQIVAQLGQVYADILSGMRGPEQLSRWLNEETYIQVANEHTLRHRARMRSKQANQREFFRVLKAEIFPSRKNTLEAVILVKSPKSIQAISMRMDVIFNRWRVTHIELI